MTKRTDTAGRATTYLYDSANRITRVTDPALQATNLEYNLRSQTTAVVDALNQRYEFVYDSLGRVTQTTRGGLSMSYAYDAVGNRSQRTDYNGVLTNYAYDALDRLTTITYPTRTASYGYDALSRLTSATNANGTVALTYDNRSRIAGTTDVFNQTVGYSYDANANRTGMSLNGSTYASYAYDAVNRLTTLADSANLTFNLSYDAMNRLANRSAPNGVTSSYAYDGLNRLTALTHAKSATTLINNQYTYNDANNIATWSNAAGNHSYAYDAVDRLTSATNGAQQNESYSYDAVGNRTASHLSASYGYQPFNRMTSSAIATYSYDNNGNLVSKTDLSGTTTFAYDEDNRLKQVTLPSNLVVNYKYDALGRRIQRTTTAGANERYVYDRADALLDLNADGSVAISCLNGRGIDNHLRQTSATTGVSYYPNDHLGSSAGFADTSGSLVETDSYDSFGNGADSSRTRHGYTGRERDPDTGALYYRARFYDPQTGRFVSEDPISFNGRDVNFYAYVKNRPLLFRDPSGLRRCDPIVGALIGAGAGGVLGLIGGELVGVPAGALVGETVGGPPGGLGGAIVGGLVGPPGGFIAGAFGGAYVGALICSGGEATCDMAPPTVIPFPKPEPRPTPLFPPLPVKPGKICPLKEQVGRICVYECADGTRFTTMVSDRNQKCPPFAGI